MTRYREMTVARAGVERAIVLTMALGCLALVSGETRPASLLPDGVKHGEYRSWHSNGQLAEVRRYVNGREEGLQQSWAADGVLFLNYEVRAGRRFGLVNARPCLPAEPQARNGQGRVS